MTRAEALTKLLALGRMSRDRIQAVTGWPYRDVACTLQALQDQGVIELVPDGFGAREYALVEGVPSPFAGAPA